MSFMQGDNLGDIVKPYSETFHVVDIAGGDTVKLFEDVLLILFGNTDAVVGHLNDGITTLGAGGDDDVRFLFGIFDGVVDKVVNHVRNVQFICKKSACYFA